MARREASKALRTRLAPVAIAVTSLTLGLAACSGASSQARVNTASAMATGSASTETMATASSAIGSMPMSSASMSTSGAASGTMSMGIVAALTGKALDRTFIVGMVPHHQAAIDMAKVELAKGKNPQAKQLAQTIIDEQQREMGQMQQIGKTVFNMTPSTTMAMSGTDGALMGEPVEMDMSQMAAQVQAAADTDTAFLQLMIPHHAMAIIMAQTEQKQGDDSQLKALSQAIIMGQAKEIGRMESLLSSKS